MRNLSKAFLIVWLQIFKPIDKEVLEKYTRKN